ncbi:cell wall metabolism sensor histidine kinase WalK [Mycobacterium sp. URHB0044]|uniref:sensor histidine kinase n=1 Tax=Mycobacterium sp. URHB0044 TaxID=1380386 RepID=UPI00048CC8CA|nr:HAMP domain-containing sensor histidine kinase [Mycobacterium sp. URHB0044]
MSRWRTWTLRRQLVLGVSAIVMVVLLTVGVLSVLTLRSSLSGVIDTQLTASADGFSYSVTKYRISPTADGRKPPPGAMKPLTQVVGQAPGNVIALVQNGKVVDSARFEDGEAGPAPREVVDKIPKLAAWIGIGKHDVDLPGHGEYLMEVRPGDGDERLVTAVSLEPAQKAVARETAIVAALTALALLVTALGTIAIVRFALRPLGRVAATAAEVATLKLDRDHHSITPRVPRRDTDRRTEVGLVGDTLNSLLEHVERALAEVAASDRRMRRFITDASHELRTPLAAIHGYAELTRQDSSVLPDTTEYSLARIEAEARRMSSLVSDLLLLARLDEGEDLDTTEVDLTDVVIDAVNDAAVSAPNHHWLTNVPDGAVWVVGDRARLHQLLVSLLSNAWKHTPAETTVTTAVATGRADDGAPYAELTVVDDGPGIDRDLLPHLFERFVRADESRSHASGSFGLGLSIAASIVEAHRGTIDAESAPGRTTFRVRLVTIHVRAQQVTST